MLHGCFRSLDHWKANSGSSTRLPREIGPGNSWGEMEPWIDASGLAKIERDTAEAKNSEGGDACRWKDADPNGADL